MSEGSQTEREERIESGDLSASISTGRSLSRRMSRMGRRGFTKTLAALGVSGSTLRSVPYESAAEEVGDPRDEVLRAVSHKHTNHKEVVEQNAPPKRETKTKLIDRDRWVNIEAFPVAAAKVSESFDQYPQVVVKPLNKPNKGKRVFVDYTFDTENGSSPSISFEEVKRLAPSSVTGELTWGEHGNKTASREYKVVVRKNRTEPTAKFDSKYRPVPAGCQIQNPNDLEYGTIGATVYDNENYEYAWATAAHVTNRNTGVSILQPGSFDAIGSVDRVLSSGDGDVEVITPDGVDTTQQLAAEDGGYDTGLKGVFAEDELNDMADRNEVVSFQGRTSGDVLTEMTGVGYDVGVRTHLADRSQGGDSGGVQYDFDSNGDRLSIGIIGGNFGNDGDQYGTATFYAESELSFTV